MEYDNITYYRGKQTTLASLETRIDLKLILLTWKRENNVVHLTNAKIKRVVRSSLVLKAKLP